MHPGSIPSGKNITNRFNPSTHTFLNVIQFQLLISTGEIEPFNSSFNFIFELSS